MNFSFTSPPFFSLHLFCEPPATNKSSHISLLFHHSVARFSLYFIWTISNLFSPSVFLYWLWHPVSTVGLLLAVGGEMCKHTAAFLFSSLSRWSHTALIMLRSGEANPWLMVCYCVFSVQVCFDCIASGSGIIVTMKISAAVDQMLPVCYCMLHPNLRVVFFFHKSTLLLTLTVMIWTEKNLFSLFCYLKSCFFTANFPLKLFLDCCWIDFFFCPSLFSNFLGDAAQIFQLIFCWETPKVAKILFYFLFLSFSNCVIFGIFFTGTNDLFLQQTANSKVTKEAV